MSHLTLFARVPQQLMKLKAQTVPEAEPASPSTRGSPSLGAVGSPSPRRRASGAADTTRAASSHATARSPATRAGTRAASTASDRGTSAAESARAAASSAAATAARIAAEVGKRTRGGATGLTPGSVAASAAMAAANARPRFTAASGGSYAPRQSPAARPHEAMRRGNTASASDDRTGGQGPAAATYVERVPRGSCRVSPSPLLA